MKNYICTNRAKVNCDPPTCATCGWESAEEKRRKEYLRKYGLTLCEDGLQRLVIDQKHLQKERFEG